MRLLAIDPSLSCSGWALFEGSELSGCGVVPTLKWRSFLTRVTETSNVLMREGISSVDSIVVEWPEIYKGQKRGNPNALLCIAAVVGASISNFSGQEEEPDVALVKPRQWKGQKKKEDHNRITMSRMTEDELKVLESRMQGVPKRFHNNAIDAIGIGLWFLKRGSNEQR